MASDAPGDAATGGPLDLAVRGRVSCRCSRFRQGAAMKRRFHFASCALAFSMAGLMGAAQSASTVKDFKPITDQQLRNPDPGDWIHWRRTLDGWGYSPLNQITRQNVSQLQLVWSWSMQPGSNQPTPLVHNGIMYLPN